MKSLLVKLGVILIGLIISGCAEVWGAEWRNYTETHEYSASYDAESIARPSKNIVRVWTRYDFEENSSLGSQIILHEIDCTQRTARELSVTTYTKEGKLVTKGSEAILKDWFLIEPESMAEVLLKKVCG